LSQPFFIRAKSVFYTAMVLLSAFGSLHAEDTPAPIMEVDQLQRGMRGYGLSVFQGVQIDTFAVEILGVIKGGIGPGHDLILARLSGANLEHTGIIRGMSGSPVYINEQLIGAVSYGWSYSKDPIGGITPIATMLDVTRRPLDSERQQQSRKPLYFSPSRLTGDSSAPDHATLEPLKTPIALSGFDGLAQQVLSEALGDLGLETVQGPGTGAALDSLQTAVVPGAGLGIQLIRGDRNATAIGTLTWTDGDSFVGFGHPMLHSGATDMPATGAFIHQVIPSQVASFKLGSPTQSWGAVRQDRLPGVAGKLGVAPAMVPVSAVISSNDRSRSFNFEVMRHRDLLPVLARSVLISAMQAAEKLSGDASLVLSSQLYLHGGRVLENDQFYSGPSAAFVASLEAVQPLVALAHSRFKGLDVDSLSFAVQIREGIAQAHIAGLRLHANQLQAGRRYALEITLAPFRADAVKKSVEFTVPAGTPPGSLLLRVGNGEMSSRWENARRPDAFAARDAEHLLTLLSMPNRADELVVELVRATPGFTLEGRELPSLPPSARAVLQSGTSSGHLGPVHEEVLLRHRLPTNFALSGTQSIEITLIAGKATP